jgi:SAM-dependent methyltransferase
LSDSAREKALPASEGSDPGLRAYAPDLAYIHDAGHGDFARRAGPALLSMFRERGLKSGLVIDLGCGSGIWAEQLVASGYDVLGIDISPAMIELARRRVPGGEFRGGSFLAVELPPCAAVTALGEVFSYVFDAGNTATGLSKLLRRIHAALAPGGMLVFDVVTPGRVPEGGPRQLFREGSDWAVLVTATEDDSLLTRDITTFRKVGEAYRRAREVHRQRVFDAAEVERRLRRTGFCVRRVRGYGELRFPPGVTGFVARKHDVAKT